MPSRNFHRLIAQAKCPAEAPRARKKPAPGLTAPAAFAKAKLLKGV